MVASPSCIDLTGLLACKQGFLAFFRAIRRIRRIRRLVSYIWASGRSPKFHLHASVAGA